MTCASHFSKGAGYGFGSCLGTVAFVYLFAKFILATAGAELRPLAFSSMIRAVSYTFWLLLCSGEEAKGVLT